SGAVGDLSPKPCVRLIRAVSPPTPAQWEFPQINGVHRGTEALEGAHRQPARRAAAVRPDLDDGAVTLHLGREIPEARALVKRDATHEVVDGESVPSGRVINHDDDASPSSPPPRA